jgi:nucleotide-binding universal stress UspA family protein
MRFKKILAPTDLSEVSQPAVRYAVELAKAEGGEVLVFHVVGNSEEWLARHDDLYSRAQFIEKRKKQLAQFLHIVLGELLSQVCVRQEVAFGVPHELIVAKAGEEKADLIVMSTHGWSGLLHVLIGSVTEKVVNHAACSVLSIHPAEGLAPTPSAV